MRSVVVLPAPLGPRKPKIGAGRHGELDAVQGGLAAVALGQAAQLDARRAPTGPAARGAVAAAAAPSRRSPLLRRRPVEQLDGPRRALGGRPSPAPVSSGRGTSMRPTAKYASGPSQLTSTISAAQIHLL